MSAEEQTIVTPAPEVPAAPAAPVAPETPAAPPAEAPSPENRREFLAHQMKQRRGEHAKFQPREQGKFAGAPQFPTPSGPAAAAAPQDAPAKPPVIERPAMPKSWNMELKSHWDTAPVELLKRFTQREEEMARGVEGFHAMKSKAQVADELLNEFKPYEMLIRSENGTPQTVIRNLLQTAAIFRVGSPMQKAQAAAHIMRQFGISLEQVQPLLSGNAPPQPALDPQYSQLSHQVQQLQARQQQWEQAEEQKAMTAIDRFAAQPEHKHFSTVAPVMLAILTSEKFITDSSGMGEDAKLAKAYDMAIYADPSIRSEVLAEQQAAERARQQVEQAKKAAVQVTGAPAAGPAPKPDPNDRKEFLRHQFALKQR